MIGDENSDINIGENDKLEWGKNHAFIHNK